MTTTTCMRLPTGSLQRCQSASQVLPFHEKFYRLAGRLRLTNPHSCYPSHPLQDLHRLHLLRTMIWEAQHPMQNLTSRGHHRLFQPRMMIWKRLTSFLQFNNPKLSCPRTYLQHHSYHRIPVQLHLNTSRPTLSHPFLQLLRRSD